MRILYCSQDYSPHDHRFLSALSKSNHSIYWLRLEDQKRNLEARNLPESIHPVKWRDGKETVRWWQYPELKNKFQKVIREIKPDLIHAGPIQTVAVLPAMLHFHPLVSMSWGFDMLQDAERSPIWKSATKYVLRRTDRLFCDCQTVKKKSVKWGFPADRVTVFPWGVDLKRFSPQSRKKKSKELVILSTRSWEPRYGIDVALKGFALAVQQEKDLKLIMLSGGSQEGWIRNFIRENKLEQNVELRGQINNDDLTQIYNSAQVYLSASHIDGSSVALMEALACGTPALVSDIPSNLEWVSDGVEGWVFMDGDAADLSRAILSIAANPEKLAAASKNARQKAEQNADWQKNFNTLLEGYTLAWKETEK